MDTFYGASFWLVTAVAVERYVNVVKRIEFYKSSSLKTTNIVIIAIWVISFLVVSLPIFLLIEFDDGTLFHR